VASETRKVLVEGTVVGKGGNLVPNEAGIIIRHLLEAHLVKIASREGGWTTLFLNPLDGEYWELTYPRSELHGGGPRQLTPLTTEEVRQFYNLPDV
jgi:hypothetical protein